MSANIQEATERQRELLYTDKTDTQLIMIALHNLMVAVNAHSPALMCELYDRYSQSNHQQPRKEGGR